MKSIAAWIIKKNRYASKAFDKLLPAGLRVDGNRYFYENIILRISDQNPFIYDVGSGSQPCLSRDQKNSLNARVVGLDISTTELESAPIGLYDQVVVADITNYNGNSDADLVLCRALLEHVPDVRGAMKALSTIPRVGGKIHLFIPGKNAAFARLNRVISENLKKKLLFSLFPESVGHQGFKAWYDRCTPGEITKIAGDLGLKVTYKRVFWMSTYFEPIFPLFVIWRIYQAFSYLLYGQNAAESFVITLEKSKV